MNARRLVLAGLITTCVVSVASFASEADQASPTFKYPEFTGKVLLVYLTRKSDYPNYIMVDSRVRQIGHMMFLSGKFADIHPKKDGKQLPMYRWRSGLETNVAWNSIRAYQVLSPKQYDKFLADGPIAR